MRIKTVLIVTAFFLNLVFVTAIRQALSGDFSIHKVDFYESGDDWNGFKFNNITLSKDNDNLLVVSNDQPGIFESLPRKTDYEFNEILMSWNCLVMDSSSLFISIAVSPDSVEWYNFSYQKWGEASSEIRPA